MHNLFCWRTGGDWSKGVGKVGRAILQLALKDWLGTCFLSFVYLSVCRSMVPHLSFIHIYMIGVQLLRNYLITITSFGLGPWVFFELFINILHEDHIGYFHD